MKKVFYFSIAFLFLALIFLAAYNFAFKHNVNDPISDSEKNIIDKDADPFDSGPMSSIVSTLNEDILDAVTSENGELFYYSLEEQSLKKASLEGKNKSVLLSNLPGKPLRIVWSPKRDRVLILLKQTSGPHLWHFADLTTKTLVPLKPEIGRLAWNNLGDKIFYQYTDSKSGARTLNLSDPDGRNWKKVVALGSDSFIAAVPRSATISFWSRPNALEKTSLETVSITGENRRLVFSEKFGGDYLWSPDGEKVLVSLSEEKGGRAVLLNSMNSNGGELQNLSVPTLLSKTVWSKDSKTIYFALPGALPENIMLPNDYFEKNIHTKDTFWKMDLVTGKKTRLTDLKEVTQSFDSIGLFLSPDENTLFFIDRNSSRLYQIDL